MAVLAGQRETNNVASTQRVIDLHKPILLLEPDAAPITVITKQYAGGLMRENAQDPKFTWHNDRLETRTTTVNFGAGYASTATSIVVASGNVVAVDDLIKVPRTAEVFQVTAVSTNTLTIVRGIGSTTAAALVDTDPLYIIGTAAEEGSRAEAARSENPTVVTNYCQIFKHTVEASGTWMSSSNNSTPHDFPHQARKTMIEHLKDIEGAFLFSGPGEATGPNSKKQRSTGGLLYYMTSNNQAAGGVWSIIEVNSFLRTITRYGSRSKTFFCSALVASVLDEHSQGKMQTHVGDDTFGVKILTYQTNLGELKIVPHRLLDDAGYTGYGIAVDFKAQALGYRYLNGNGPGGARDTHVLPNRQEEDRDGQKDEILTECGLRCGLPETGGVVTGVTASV
jgi:Family of unknown function (DUF5309)